MKPKHGPEVFAIGFFRPEINARNGLNESVQRGFSLFFCTNSKFHSITIGAMIHFEKSSKIAQIWQKNEENFFFQLVFFLSRPQQPDMYMPFF